MLVKLILKFAIVAAGDVLLELELALAAADKALSDIVTRVPSVEELAVEELASTSANEDVPDPVEAAFDLPLMFANVEYDELDTELIIATPQ